MFFAYVFFSASADCFICKSSHMRFVWIIIIKLRSKLEEERRGKKNVLFMKTIGLWSSFFNVGNRSYLSSSSEGDRTMAFLALVVANLNYKISHLCWLHLYAFHLHAPGRCSNEYNSESVHDILSPCSMLHYRSTAGGGVSERVKSSRIVLCCAKVHKCCAMMLGGENLRPCIILKTLLLSTQSE